jgi:1-acyl-sn-glycerol-3-phosphate acyltransferase
MSTARTTTEELRDDANWYVRGVALVGRVAMRCLTRVRVHGLVDGSVEGLPTTGPLIIAANHISNADGVLVGSWITKLLGRRLHWLGKREFVEWPIVGRMAEAFSVHPVDRGTGDIEAFRLAQRILETGHVLMVFPEGTRSPTGTLQEAKDGLALLALRSKAPILPVGVSGTDRFWPKGSPPRPGGSVELQIGTPFTLDDVPGLAQADRREQKRLATEAIMARIAALVPERQRGFYGGSRPPG